MNYYIGVDFDGTLVTPKFPNIGERQEKVISALLKRKKFLEERYHYNVFFILWTCREDVPERKYLQEAVDFCKNNIPEIPLKYVNENPDRILPEQKIIRKINCNEFWDDKAMDFKEMI